MPKFLTRLAGSVNRTVAIRALTLVAYVLAPFLREPYKNVRCLIANELD